MNVVLLAVVNLWNRCQRLYCSTVRRSHVKQRDWTLLAVAAAGERGLDPVQLQKSLFILSREVPKRDLGTQTFYKFDPYDYGPFSSDVYADAEALEFEGLVEIRRPPETRYKQYLLTPEGRRRVQQVKKECSDKALAYLTKVVKFAQSVSFNQLVRAIYAEYPEMQANSVFKG